jgi:hypothetical protein
MEREEIKEEEVEGRRRKDKGRKNYEKKKMEEGIEGEEEKNAES